MVDFSGLDGTGSLTVELESDSQIESFTRPVDSIGGQNFFFANYPAIDFSAIDTVRVTLSGMVPAADFSIRSITVAQVAIPEPATLLLAGLALAIVTSAGQTRQRVVPKS